MQLRWRSAARTHPGLVRQVNEDSMLVRDDTALWVVADGMGGHDNGQWASQTLVGQFAHVALDGALESRGGALATALDDGNRAIVSASAASGKQMGTTAVVAHVDGSEVLCLWVGDSRIYRWRHGLLTQLTRDHSVVQELVDRGHLDASEAESHPMAHVLSRAIGTEAELRYENVVDVAVPGDRYLLCSDGLTKVVPEDVIAAVLGLGNIDRAADELVSSTLERGAPDNVTLVIVLIEEVTAVIGGAA